MLIAHCTGRRQIDALWAHSKIVENRVAVSPLCTVHTIIRSYERASANRTDPPAVNLLYGAGLLLREKIAKRDHACPRACC